MTKFKVGDRVSHKEHGKGKIEEISENDYYYSDSFGFPNIPNIDRYQIIDGVYYTFFKKTMYHVFFDKPINLLGNPLWCEKGNLKKLRPKKSEFKVGDRVSFPWQDGVEGKGTIKIVDEDWINVLFDDGVLKTIFLIFLLKKLKKAKTMLKVGDRVRIKSIEKLNKGKVIKINESGVFEIKKDSGGLYYTSSRDDLVRLGYSESELEKLLNCECEIGSGAICKWCADKTLIKNKDGIDWKNRARLTRDLYQKLKKENQHLKSCICECGEDMVKLSADCLSDSIREYLLQKENKELKDQLELSASSHVGHVKMMLKENEELKKDKGILSREILSHQNTIISLGRLVNELKTKLEKPTLDLTKPVQTRDGDKARIVCVDANKVNPIIALVYYKGEEMSLSFTKNGHFYGDTREFGMDLINVPEEK
jgi:hypothetical protein